MTSSTKIKDSNVTINFSNQSNCCLDEDTKYLIILMKNIFNANAKFFQWMRIINDDVCMNEVRCKCIIENKNKPTDTLNY